MHCETARAVRIGDEAELDAEEDMGALLQIWLEASLLTLSARPAASEHDEQAQSTKMMCKLGAQQVSVLRVIIQLSVSGEILILHFDTQRGCHVD